MSAAQLIPIPVVGRPPLLAVALLVGFALFAAFAGPWRHAGATPPEGKAALERWLIFADRPDGGVVVTDAVSRRVLDVITGQNGFFRVTLSGLARIRRIEGIGPAAPFTLSAYADRRLTLGDPTTGKVIELEAFGPTNEAVFARLLQLR